MLVVDDDPGVRRALQHFFELKGYEVTAARDGEEALHYMQCPTEFDIILLDLMLPKRSGFDVLRTVRRLGLSPTVLLLTAQGHEASMLQGFELGATDYVAKPFDAEVLAARVRAILGRTKSPGEAPMEVYRLGDLEVNFSTHRAHRQGTEVSFTKHEYALLRYLIQKQGQTVSRKQLLCDVWSITGDVVTRTVDRHMASLRKKIEPDTDAPRYIETIYGVGYRLRSDA